MPEVSAQTAIERAREVLAVDRRGNPGRAHFVARLDRAGCGYYLVDFGQEHATIAVAAVDAFGGGVLSHAWLPGSGPHLAVNAAGASDLAGAIGVGHTRLVWCPSQASLSMLSPFWEVATARGTVYVDQQRRVWTELKRRLPGG